MPNNKNLKELDKITRREADWLMGEFSHLAKLKKAVAEKDRKSAEKVFRLMARDERKLDAYHKRLIKAIGIAEKQGLSPQDSKLFEYIKSKMNVFEAEMEDDLSRFRGEVPKLLAKEDWNALSSLLPRIEQAIKAWYALDNQLLEFEKRIYSSESVSAEIIYKVVRELEENPNLISNQSYMRRFWLILIKSKNAVKIVKEKMKTAWKIGSVTSKTIIYIFALWFYIEYVNPFLKPTTYHQTIRNIELQMNDRMIVQRWIDNLTKEQKKIMLESYLKDKEYIVKEELNKLISAYSNDFYTMMIDQVYQSQLNILNNLRRNAGKDTALNISNFKVKPRSQVEIEFVRGFGMSSPDQVKADIAKGLRNYFIVEIMDGKLPKAVEMIKDIGKGNFVKLFEHIRWGAGELESSLVLRDMIRKELNTQLEPAVNAVKESINIPNTIWNAVTDTAIKTIRHPSQAKQNFEELRAMTLKLGGGAAVLGLLMLLTGTLAWAILIFRWFVVNYIKDIFYLAGKLKRKKKVRR